MRSAVVPEPLPSPRKEFAIRFGSGSNKRTAPGADVATERAISCAHIRKIGFTQSVTLRHAHVCCVMWHACVCWFLCTNRDRRQMIVLPSVIAGDAMKVFARRL